MSALDRQAGGPDDNAAQAGHLIASSAVYTAECGCPYDWIDADGFCACCHAHLDDPRGLYAEQGDGTHLFKRCPARAQGGHPIAAPLTRGSAKSPGVNEPGRRQEDDVNLAINGAGVRRLTPVECERLMSWPDGWTAVDGSKTPDSRRYAACGDGVVSNVAEWIGRRIVACEEGWLT